MNHNNHPKNPSQGTSLRDGQNSPKEETILFPLEFRFDFYPSLFLTSQHVTKIAVTCICRDIGAQSRGFTFIFISPRSQQHSTWVPSSTKPPTPWSGDNRALLASSHFFVPFFHSWRRFLILISTGWCYSLRAWFCVGLPSPYDLILSLCLASPTCPCLPIHSSLLSLTGITTLRIFHSHPGLLLPKTELLLPSYPQSCFISSPTFSLYRTSQYPCPSD